MGYPESSNVTEFVIVGKDQIEAITKILALFKEHKVGLVGLASQSLPQVDHFVITAYTDIKSSDLTLPALLDQLRDLLAIESAKGAELGGSRYDKLLFPVLALDASRLVITSAENLAQVENYFSKLPRETGTQALFEVGRQSGLAIVRSLRRLHPREPQKGMLAMAEDELRTSGWGLFSFDVSEMEHGIVGVSVREPIMMNVLGAKESWITYGLCSGLVEGIYGMAGYVSGGHAYSEKTKQMKFKLVELTSDQRDEGSGR
jgi:hypothetical protein